MNDERREHTQEAPYIEPRVIATFRKEELETRIRPHGPVPSYGDQGCGTGCSCGCGCSGTIP